MGAGFSGDLDLQQAKTNAMFKRLCLASEGVLYEDGTLQIGVWDATWPELADKTLPQFELADVDHKEKRLSPLKPKTSKRPLKRARVVVGDL